LGHGVVRLMRNKGLGWGTIWAVRRVVVVGAGGAGKSVFAARLGEATGLPVVELDKIFWRPGLLAIDDQ
jgi:shikimate 5-dehydrogenase